MSLSFSFLYLRDLWKQLSSARSAVAPNELWQQLRTNHVRFDEQIVCFSLGETVRN